MGYFGSKGCSQVIGDQLHHKRALKIIKGYPADSTNTHVRWREMMLKRGLALLENDNAYMIIMKFENPQHNL